MTIRSLAGTLLLFFTFLQVPAHPMAVPDDAITWTVFPGTCRNSVRVGDWIYYAPGEQWDTAEKTALAQDAHPGHMLTRQHIMTRQIETFDLQRIVPSAGECVGIATDGTNIYLSSYEGGVVYRIEPSTGDFPHSRGGCIRLPLAAGSYLTSALYHDGYLYVAPLASGVFYRIDISRFRSEEIEHLDVSLGDPRARGFNGLCLDSDGYLWAAPNWNGQQFHGTVVRINTRDFSPTGVSSIDLTSYDPSARGYLGIVYVNGYVALAPHRNEIDGFHARIAVIDTNVATGPTVRIIDASSIDPRIGGMLNCVVAEDLVIFFPYQNNTQEAYATFTFLDTISMRLQCVPLNEGHRIMPYGGVFVKGVLFCSPWQEERAGRRYLSALAYVLDLTSIMDAVREKFFPLRTMNHAPHLTASPA